MVRDCCSDTVKAAAVRQTGGRRCLYLEGLWALFCSVLVASFLFSLFVFVQAIERDRMGK